MLLEALRFTEADARRAHEEWRFNCGPAALCAVLGLTPTELRPCLLDFEQRGYMNPTLMADVLRNLGVRFARVYECLGRDTPSALPRYPQFGLMRVQWAGPWTGPDVPIAARYRHTHWVGIRHAPDRHVFDVNAVQYGGWLPWHEWSTQLVPWLLKQIPRADGRWWPTHCWEIDR